MLGTTGPRDLVEDQDQQDPTKQEADHEISVARCEPGSAWSEDDGDDDLDLEKCLLEEMDAMDASESEQSIESGVETETSRSTDLQVLETITRDKEDCADAANVTLEWSRFMNSTEGVLKYMQRATAEILDANKLEPPPPHTESTTRDSSAVETAESGPGSSSTGMILHSMNNPSEALTRHAAFPPQLHCEDVKNITATTGFSTLCASHTGHRGSPTARLLAPHSRTSRDFSAPDRPVSTPSTAAEHQHDVVKESETDVSLAEVPMPGVGLCVREGADTSHPHVSPPRAPGVSGSPRRGAGPIPDKSNSAASPAREAVPAADMPILTSTNDNVDGDRLAQNMTFSLVDKGDGDISGAMGSKPEIHFEASLVSNSQREKSGCAYVGGGTSMIADSFSRIEVITSVGEAEVARRVNRQKARCVVARQQRRDESIKKARLAESVVAFQAVWRGCCARGNIAPALAARRRELEETKLMIQEEQLAENVVVLEAQRREVEAKIQSQEQTAMRCEEKRTCDAWMFLRTLEETARGEELVRMRAEERCTRALLDLELQDLRRVERGRREAEEAIKMQSEDQAMRNLTRLEETQALEREAMGAEDALARSWKAIEQCELVFSRAEGCRMVVEDSTSSAWNVEYRHREKIRLHQAWARSTPVQRAMDPKGIAAAQALVRSCPTGSSRQSCTVAGAGTEAEWQLSAIANWRRTLMLERARRRNYCKGHLARVSSNALRVQCRRQASLPVKGLDMQLAGYGRDGNIRGVSKVGAPSGGDGQASPRGEGGPAERDGAECELTMDMLSHLGPLKDLQALELCVEGLTSVSLLQACTSLKLLSLNVNRLSSPAGLAVSTSLVRLGLRDNRLSSLQGLSGLPSLRELRLDINHLTSLHELKQLPSLIELSANTNHIRELPEGFAAGLLSPRVSISGNDSYNNKAFSTLVEKAVACGGLQKLELYHNRISFVHPRALQGLASLTHLDLGRNQLIELDGQGLESCPALSTLVLSQNLLQEPPSPLCLPLLSELWLSGNRINSMDAWASSPTPAAMSPIPTRYPQQCTLSKETWMVVSGGAIEGRNGSPPGHQDARNRELRETGSEGRQGIEKAGHGSEGERRPGTPSGREGRTFGEVGVWLPTLEILHLQDNTLKTLGGRSVFVGCPLLRSFDASFNQLSTPDDICKSLQACGDLEEVRLHDNPASACQNYRDAVALSCPNLTRMDGIQLDSKVHWQARADAYGGRADLVLPFLNSDETSRTHGIAVTAAKDPAPGSSASESKEAHAVEVDESCPWCGVGMPCKEQYIDTGGGGGVGGSDLGGRGNEGGDDGELDSASLARRDDGIPRRATCTSCGFTFPDTNLWSVPESARYSLNWEDVCLAGDRGRRKFCPDAGARGTAGKSSQEEGKVSTTFRKTCLRGRDERTNMKRRHRREERDLAARAELSCAKPRAAKEGGDGTSRLASLTPSTWRLDDELELEKRQAEERRDQVARQLCFHGGGGADHQGTGGTGEADIGPSATAGKQAVQATANRPDLFEKSGTQQRSGRRQSRAAGLIQRLWRRRRERTELVRRGLEGGTKEPAKEQAVMKLQSAFRGFHVRRALQAALESARYVDEELEDLLTVNGGASFELDRFLCPPPELSDGWWGGASRTSVQNVPGEPTPTPPSRARATSNRLIDTARAVVSNAPLRCVRGEHAVETPSETGLASPLFGRGTEKDNNVGATIKTDDELRFERSPAILDLGKESDLLANTGRNGANVRGADNPARGGGNALAKAWGLKDPSVARAMIKRAKRMRNFQNGEARREKFKNPGVRFDVFVRNAGGRRRKRVGSSRSDHGGELGTHRSGGSEDDWGQGPGARSASPRLAPIVDAWVRSEKVGDNTAVVATDPAAQLARAGGRPWPPIKPSRLVAAKAPGGSHRTPLCAHDLGAEVVLKSGQLLTGGERRAGVG